MSIAKSIDHTLLKVESTRADIEALCREAKDLQTYSVCVNPAWVSTAAAELQGSDVKVCSVVGFPLGATYQSAILTETELAIAHGASEIDMVMNVGAFKSGNYTQVRQGIVDVTNLADSLGSDIEVKVIVESAVLTQDEKRRIASIIAESGADFLKTSTGFVPNDHLIEDVQLFISELPGGFKVKAAGGIRNYATAKQLIDLGVARLGASSTRKILEEERAASN